MNRRQSAVHIVAEALLARDITSMYELAQVSEREVLKRAFTRLANMPVSECRKWLSKFKSPRRGGRPRTNMSGPQLLEWLEVVRPFFEKRDGKPYSDRALLLLVRSEHLQKNGQTRPNEISERAHLKTLLNRISEARRDQGASRKL
jgi:hypothetical protein